jgi:hypothetical protein
MGIPEESRWTGPAHCRHIDCRPESETKVPAAPAVQKEPHITDAELQSLEYTYQQLVKGAGRELVNDDNVDALIRRAEQDDHRMLATELREWQAACGRDVPSTIAPSAGFDRDNAKR